MSYFIYLNIGTGTSGNSSTGAIWFSLIRWGERGNIGLARLSSPLIAGTTGEIYE
jgi:hypothetical protein